MATKYIPPETYAGQAVTNRNHEYMQQPITRPRSLHACRDLLEDRLTRVLGAVIGGDHLHRSLGFPTSTAFRRACERGTVGIRVFQIRGRRGRFALATDVADWIMSQAAANEIPAAPIHDHTKEEDTRTMVDPPA